MLVSFEGDRTLFLDRTRYIGWKKEYYDTRVLGLVRQERAQSLVASYNEGEFFQLSAYNNDTFQPRFRLKTGMLGRKHVCLAAAEAKAFVLDGQVVLSISLKNFQIIKRIDFEKIAPPLTIISNILYYRDF